MFEVDKCLWLYCQVQRLLSQLLTILLLLELGCCFITTLGTDVFRPRQQRYAQTPFACHYRSPFCSHYPLPCVPTISSLVFPLSPPLCTILPAPGFLVSSQSNMAASSFDRNIKHLLTRKYDDYGVQVDFDDRTSDIRYFFFFTDH